MKTTAKDVLHRLAAESCARKSRFVTKALARAHNHGKLKSYRCHVCDGWHLTSAANAAELKTMYRSAFREVTHP